MPKTLQDAIGCWTGREGMLVSMRLVQASIGVCDRATRRGDAEQLKGELTLLLRRLETLKDLALAAQKRLQYIVDTKELDR